MPSTGGAPRQVAEVGSEAAWSPDSERIVFSSDAGNVAAQPFQCECSAPLPIFPIAALTPFASFSAGPFPQ